MIARFRKSVTLRHGALVLGGVIVANIFNYLYYMLIGRRAGIETYGVVTSLASALLVVGAPATVGQIIAARLAAEIHASGNRAALGTLADAMTKWTTVVAAIIIAIGMLSRDSIAAFFNLTDARPVVMVVISLGVFSIVMVQRGILQGAHRFGDYSVSLSIDAIGRVLVGIPLVTVLGATGGLLGILAGVIVALAYSAFAIRKSFGSDRAPITLDRKLITRIVSQVGLGQLTFTVLTFYDVPLIKHLFDARSAGLYAAAALVGRAVLSAVSFVPTLVLPKATARFAAGRSPLPLLATALGLAAIIVGIALVAGAVAPRAVVTLIAGNAFGEATTLVLPYTVASGALALANVVAAYNMGLHRYDFVLPVVAIAAVEIALLSVWHPSLAMVVYVLVGGHGAVLLATLFRRRCRLA